MRIATWNINSVRLRLPQVIKFLKIQNIDLLCLQETKTPNEYFPDEEFKKIGFKYQYNRGEKSYNGVAIISRLPLGQVHHKDWAKKIDCRHICAQIENGPSIHNFYVPAGGDVPDSEENPKFGHKLDFLSEMTHHFTDQRPQNAILVGDLNIAPLAEDVWSSKQLLKVVSHTPVETEALKRLMSDGGWVDVVREHFGADEKLYSWWSYRARDWATSNRGRRLDHIWMSHDLAPSLKMVDIRTDYRGAEKPSDHVPMIVEV